MMIDDVYVGYIIVVAVGIAFQEICRSDVPEEDERVLFYFLRPGPEDPARFVDVERQQRFHVLIAAVCQCEFGRYSISSFKMRTSEPWNC